MDINLIVRCIIVTWPICIVMHMFWPCNADLAMPSKYFKVEVVLLYQGSYTSWKSWNVLDFCNDNFQGWKVLENERKSWKTPGKIKTS